jgi:hypothetical protein
MNREHSNRQSLSQAVTLACRPYQPSTSSGRLVLARICCHRPRRMGYRFVYVVVFCALSCGRGTLDLSLQSDSADSTTPSPVAPPETDDPDVDQGPDDHDRPPSSSEPSRDEPEPSAGPKAPSSPGDPPDAGPGQPTTAPTSYPPTAPSSSTPPMLQRCFEDANCSLERPYCTGSGFCGECLEREHCSAATDGRALCDRFIGSCVECYEPDHCAPGSQCSFPEQRCLPGCDEHNDCPGQQCLFRFSQCVECVWNDICYAMNGPSKAVCDRETNSCRPCRGDQDCEGEARCDDGTCVGGVFSGGMYGGPMPDDPGGPPSFDDDPPEEVDPAMQTSGS